MPAATVGWAGVLAALDRTRSRALATGRTGLLAGVYVVGSVPWQGDTALMAGYASRHVRIENASVHVLSTSVVRRGADSVTLRVTEQLGASTAVRADGGRQSVPGAAPRTRLVDLVRTTAGWRISAIRAVPTR